MMTKQTYKQVSARLQRGLNTLQKHDGLPSQLTEAYCMGYIKALVDNDQINEKVVNRLAKEYIGVIH